MTPTQHRAMIRDSLELVYETKACSHERLAELLGCHVRTVGRNLRRAAVSRYMAALWLSHKRGAGHLRNVAAGARMGLRDRERVEKQLKLRGA